MPLNIPQIPRLGANRRFNIADVSLNIFGTTITEFAKGSKIALANPEGKLVYLEDMIGGAGIFLKTPSQYYTLELALAPKGNDVNTIRAIWALADIPGAEMPVGPVMLTMRGDLWMFAWEEAGLLEFPPFSLGAESDPVPIKLGGIAQYMQKPPASI